MCKNKLIVSAAGSGKTSHLVNEALKIKKERVLITTYTIANENEIRKKIIQINKCIPSNITVQTWFSFLIQHGVKPYQGCLYGNDIKGMYFVSSQSARYIPESNIKEHYFDRTGRIYSDKISKFSIKCDEKSHGNVIDRISRIYPNILIDEIQDLAGYDLVLLKLFFQSPLNVLMVGDPRQGTYSTNYSPKHRQFRKSGITDFFIDTDSLEIDFTSLTKNHRSNSMICDFSNKLFPEFEPTTSSRNYSIEHQGIFFIKRDDVYRYLQKYSPMQLTDKRTVKVEEDFSEMNFGESKGLTFDRVLIYPTQPIINWIFNNNFELKPTSRSKFYVAITRARYSVGIVFDYDSNSKVEGITNFSFRD